MRKILLALCSAMMIFTFSMLTPSTVSAAENGCNPHVYNATYEGYFSAHYTHQYLLYNGPDGPVYGICNVTHLYYGNYPRCTQCGYIDYYHPNWQNDLGITHDSCGL